MGAAARRRTVVGGTGRGPQRGRLPLHGRSRVVARPARTAGGRPGAGAAGKGATTNAAASVDPPAVQQWVPVVAPSPTLRRPLMTGNGSESAGAAGAMAAPGDEAAGGADDDGGVCARHRDADDTFAPPMGRVQKDARHHTFSQ